VSNTAWETLSNQAVATAGIVYFLALVVYLAEWAALRQPAAERELVGAGAPAREGKPQGSDGSGTRGASPREGRVAFLGRLALLLTAIAGAAHLVGLVGRGMAADPNRVPWGNMYEFTLSGTFVVTLLYLVLYRKYALGWMGPLVVGFVVATLMVAVIWLYDAVAPLTEALNSPWLVIHVVSAVIATGAFTLGGIASIMYLVRSRAERRAEAAGRRLGGWLARVPRLDALDRLAYRVHAFAFPVWTFAVLITGPIWAHEAWSRYWNWDPKEVWAFITWVVYAGYLHARATAGWKGRKAAMLALVGVATLWFNFIGINYFSTTSQHSYAAERVVDVPAPGVPASRP